MAVIYKLAPGGHGVVVVEEGMTTQKVFDDLLDRGWSMYDLSNPETGKKLDTLDPASTLVVAVPWK
jgi:hypothetical protein